MPKLLAPEMCGVPASQAEEGRPGTRPRCHGGFAATRASPEDGRELTISNPACLNLNGARHESQHTRVRSTQVDVTSYSIYLDETSTQT